MMHVWSYLHNLIFCYPWDSFFHHLAVHSPEGMLMLLQGLEINKQRMALLVHHSVQEDFIVKVLRGCQSYCSYLGIFVQSPQKKLCLITRDATALGSLLLLIQRNWVLTYWFQWNLYFLLFCPHLLCFHWLRTASACVFAHAFTICGTSKIYCPQQHFST